MSPLFRFHLGFLGYKPQLTFGALAVDDLARLALGLHIAWEKMKDHMLFPYEQAIYKMVTYLQNGTYSNLVSKAQKL